MHNDELARVCSNNDWASFMHYTTSRQEEARSIKVPRRMRPSRSSKKQMTLASHLIASTCPCENAKVIIFLFQLVDLVFDRVIDASLVKTGYSVGHLRVTAARGASRFTIYCYLAMYWQFPGKAIKFLNRKKSVSLQSYSRTNDD